MMMIISDNEGMKLEEKELGNSCPVTLRRIAWGTAVRRIMTVT